MSAHIHAEARGAGGPQAPSGAFTVTGASPPQATPALQARKHGDGQVYRWNSSQNSQVFNSAPQQARATGSRSVDERAAERLCGPHSLSSPGRWAPSPRQAGGRGELWPRALHRAAHPLCLRGLQAQGKAFENQNTALFQYRNITLQKLRPLRRPSLRYMAGSDTHLHLWNSLPQNAVQTNNLPLPAQMPRIQQMTC